LRHQKAGGELFVNLLVEFEAFFPVILYLKKQMKKSPLHILLKNVSLECGMAGAPSGRFFHYKCVCFTHG